jgi:hypothetical protein
MPAEGGLSSMFLNIAKEKINIEMKDKEALKA